MQIRALPIHNILSLKYTSVTTYGALSVPGDDNPLFHIGDRQEQIIVAKLC